MEPNPPKSNSFTNFIEKKMKNSKIMSSQRKSSRIFEKGKTEEKRRSILSNSPTDEDDNLDDFAFESAEFSTQETKPQHETGPIIKPIIKPLEIQRVQSLSQLPLQSPSRNTLVKSTFIELSSDPQFALQDSQRGELENNCEIDFFNGFGIGDMRVLSAIKCLNEKKKDVIVGIVRNWAGGCALFLASEGKEKSAKKKEKKKNRSNTQFYPLLNTYSMEVGQQQGNNIKLSINLNDEVISLTTTQEMKEKLERAIVFAFKEMASCPSNTDVMKRRIASMFFFDLENNEQNFPPINIDATMKTYFSRKQDKDKKEEMLKIRKEMKDSTRRLKWIEQIKTSFMFITKSFENLDIKPEEEIYQEEMKKLSFYLEILQQSILFPSIHKIKKQIRCTHLDYLNAVTSSLERLIERMSGKDEIGATKVKDTLADLRVLYEASLLYKSWKKAEKVPFPIDFGFGFTEKEKRRKIIEYSKLNDTTINQNLPQPGGAYVMSIIYRNFISKKTKKLKTEVVSNMGLLPFQKIDKFCFRDFYKPVYIATNCARKVVVTQNEGETAEHPAELLRKIETNPLILDIISWPENWSQRIPDFKALYQKSSFQHNFLVACENLTNSVNEALGFEKNANSLCLGTIFDRPILCEFSKIVIFPIINQIVISGTVIEDENYIYPASQFASNADTESLIMKMLVKVTSRGPILNTPSNTNTTDTSNAQNTNPQIAGNSITPPPPPPPPVPVVGNSQPQSGGNTNNNGAGFQNENFTWEERSKLEQQVYLDFNGFNPTSFLSALKEDFVIGKCERWLKAAVEYHTSNLQIFAINFHSLNDFYTPSTREMSKYGMKAKENSSSDSNSLRGSLLGSHLPHLNIDKNQPSTPSSKAGSFIATDEAFSTDSTGVSPSTLLGMPTPKSPEFINFFGGEDEANKISTTIRPQSSGVYLCRLLFSVDDGKQCVLVNSRRRELPLMHLITKRLITPQEWKWIQQSKVLFSPVTKMLKETFLSTKNDIFDENGVSIENPSEEEKEKFLDLRKKLQNALKISNSIVPINSTEMIYDFEYFSHFLPQVQPDTNENNRIQIIVMAGLVGDPQESKTMKAINLKKFYWQPFEKFRALFMKTFFPNFWQYFVTVTGEKYWSEEIPDQELAKQLEEIMLNGEKKFLKKYNPYSQGNKTETKSENFDPDDPEALEKARNRRMALKKASGAPTGSNSLPVYEMSLTFLSQLFWPQKVLYWLRSGGFSIVDFLNDQKLPETKNDENVNKSNENIVKKSVELVKKANDMIKWSEETSIFHQLANKSLGISKSKTPFNEKILSSMNNEINSAMIVSFKDVTENDLSSLGIPTHRIHLEPITAGYFPSMGPSDFETEHVFHNTDSQELKKQIEMEKRRSEFITPEISSEKQYLETVLTEEPDETSASSSAPSSEIVIESIKLPFTLAELLNYEKLHQEPTNSEWAPFLFEEIYAKAMLVIERKEIEECASVLDNLISTVEHNFKSADDQKIKTIIENEKKALASERTNKVDSYYAYLMDAFPILKNSETPQVTQTFANVSYDEDTQYDGIIRDMILKYSQLFQETKKIVQVLESASDVEGIVNVMEDFSTADIAFDIEKEAVEKFFDSDSNPCEEGMETAMFKRRVFYNSQYPLARTALERGTALTADKIEKEFKKTQFDEKRSKLNIRGALEKTGFAAYLDPSKILGQRNTKSNPKSSSPTKKRSGQLTSRSSSNYPSSLDLASQFKAMKSKQATKVHDPAIEEQRRRLQEEEEAILQRLTVGKTANNNEPMKTGFFSRSAQNVSSKPSPKPKEKSSTPKKNLVSVSQISEVMKKNKIDVVHLLNTSRKEFNLKLDEIASASAPKREHYIEIVSNDLILFQIPLALKDNTQSRNQTIIHMIDVLMNNKRFQNAPSGFQNPSNSSPDHQMRSPRPNEATIRSPRPNEILKSPRDSSSILSPSSSTLKLSPRAPMIPKLNLSALNLTGYPNISPIKPPTATARSSSTGRMTTTSRSVSTNSILLSSSTNINSVSVTEKKKNKYFVGYSSKTVQIIVNYLLCDEPQQFLNTFLGVFMSQRNKMLDFSSQSSFEKVGQEEEDAVVTNMPDLVKMSSELQIAPLYLLFSHLLYTYYMEIFSVNAIEERNQDLFLELSNSFILWSDFSIEEISAWRDEMKHLQIANDIFDRVWFLKLIQFQTQNSSLFSAPLPPSFSSASQQQQQQNLNSARSASSSASSFVEKTSIPVYLQKKGQWKEIYSTDRMQQFLFSPPISTTGAQREKIEEEIRIWKRFLGKNVEMIKIGLVLASKASSFSSSVVNSSSNSLPETEMVFRIRQNSLSLSDVEIVLICVPKLKVLELYARYSIEDEVFQYIAHSETLRNSLQKLVIVTSEGKPQWMKNSSIEMIQQFCEVSFQNWHHKSATQPTI